MTLDTLGGYRLVRKLGQGPRAELFLAHPEGDASLARPTALKVYRPGVSDRSVIAEAEALTRAAGDHVVALRDLAMGPTGVPALILERLPGGTLGRLLRDRATLGVGEAITILAPIALTLARLHDSGVIHGGLRLEAISFDFAGTPVLACFGRSRTIEPNLPPVRLEVEQGVSEDLRAFERIASTVLERLPEPTALPALTASGWLSEVATRLFELGQPEAVRLHPEDGPDERSAGVPSRVLTAAPVMELTVAERSEAVHTEAEHTMAERTTRFAGFALPEWLDLPGLVERLDALRKALTAVRARVWAAAAAVTVALLVAVAVVPGATADATAEQPASAVNTSPGPDADAAPVSGDDPVLALPVLLETRARCIRDLSILCLDAVDQVGSAALAGDQQLVRDVRDGVELSVAITVNPADLTLEERLGDGALISLGDVDDGEPASILLMKDEVGWRIRDYLEW